MHFLLTRPQEDSEILARQLLDHNVHIFPLLNIVFGDKAPLDLSRYQAILFTSANGVRAFHHHYETPDIPAFAVGGITAKEAQSVGFSTVETAGGDVEKLAQHIKSRLSAADGPLLHISGTRMAGNLKADLDHFNVDRVMLYRADTVTKFDDTTAGFLERREIDHIPFYSPRTGQNFVELIKAAKLEDRLGKTTALCLSSAISDVIKCLDWKDIIVADDKNPKTMFQKIGLEIARNGDNG